MLKAALPPDVRRMALPRRNSDFYQWLCPWFGLRPSKCLGKGRTGGKAANHLAVITAGKATALYLTSSGKAVNTTQETFEVKPKL
jgi:hypothetical protein